jgi:hypothetical protein
MWVYWMLGLFLQKYHLPRWGDTRTNVAHFGLIVATALLFSTAPHMVTLWALGIQGGYLPLDLFGDYAGTQGPWRHVQLGLILNQTLFLPLPAFLLSLASGLVKTSNRAWMTALLALLMFSLLLATHYWLND